MNGGSLLGADAFPVAEFLSVQVHEYRALPEPRPHRRERSDRWVRRCARTLALQYVSRRRRPLPAASRRCIRSCSSTADRPRPTPTTSRCSRRSIRNPLSRPAGNDHRQHRRAEQHDASDRRQRHRPQHRQSVRRRGVGHLERLRRQLRIGQPIRRRLYAAWADAERQLRGLRRPRSSQVASARRRAALPGPEEFYNGADRIERRRPPIAPGTSSRPSSPRPASRRLTSTSSSTGFRRADSGRRR